MSDVPVVLACLQQTRTGYVYSSIEQPEPVKVELLPESAWESQEQQINGALRVAIEERVRAVGLSRSVAREG